MQHTPGPDAISRYDLGVLVARRDGLDSGLVPKGSIAALGLRLPANVQLRIDTRRVASMEVVYDGPGSGRVVK